MPSPSRNRLNDGTTISDIKANAKEQVKGLRKGASPMSLLKVARTQVLAAKDQEAQGDLRGALSCYVKTAGLLKIVAESPEFSNPNGDLRDKWNKFMQSYAQDLTARTHAVEEKLKVIEKSQARDHEDDGPNVKPGGSVADRIRALQDNGLSVGTNKRFSREVTNLPTPPTSPGRSSNHNGNPSVSSSLIPSTPTSPSPHSLVSISSFGPPSPSSSPSSSPQLDISGFAQSFPSIEELDEGHSPLSLPAAPTGAPGDHSKSVVGKALRNGDTSFRDYAVQIERPSSTPIPAMGNTFTSRPGSPKSKLSNVSSPSPRKGPLPVKNSALPRELLSYIRDYNVLLIDVRSREAFKREHIKASAIVCVEPTVLSRAGLDADKLEDSMVIAPRNETTLFENRHKFELVAVYDQSSTTFGDDTTSLSLLVKIISELAFRKILKRMPMMLVGGIDAWKQEFGTAELVRDETLMAIPKPFSPPTSPNSNNPFRNSMINSSSAGSSNGSADDNSVVWKPSPRPAASPNGGLLIDHRSTLSLDASGHSRSPADHSSSQTNGHTSISRRPAIVRSSLSGQRSKPDLASPPIASPPMGGSTSSGPITYPSFSNHSIPPAPAGPTALPGPPIQRSDFVDQSQEAMSSMHTGGRPGGAHPIDYPELSLSSVAPVLRPPPVAASPALERHSHRQPPYQPVSYTTQPGGAPKPPRINSDYPVTFWGDMQIGVSGLKNLGNTCYMNAPIQCLSATVPFSRFFTDGRWKQAINFTNKMGSQGRLVQAFAKLLHEMWGGDLPYLTPTDFRRSICQLNSQYIGSDQHDSQEFLSFLLDGIHEDLNRIMVRDPITLTPEQEAELDRLPSPIASEKEWRSWKARNDSLIVDFFQGQFRSRLQCLTCKKTSTTYNVFSILQLPIPQSRSSKVSIDRCLDALFNEETLEKDDAWDCPKCKVKRRASKTLSLARLPPILLIHLKRFEANGRFSDKVDTFVEYPMKGLDLTNYMPAPLPPGADKSELNGGLPMSPDDPRTPLPPYRYDLYGVTNHYGNLSSGHYTAYIASRGGWMLCDDSSVKQCDPKQVVNQKAYVLFYKRVKAS